MDNTFLVSIIVPVYKVEKYLRNCIESVRVQTYTNWELILVDDGSPDKCGEICDDYAQLDHRIKVLHKENGGQAQARNRGLDICTGDYVTFLDSDDYLHPDCIYYLVNIAIKTNADIVQCSYIRGTDAFFPQINRSVSEETFDNHSIFLKGKANVIVWGKLYKREIVEAHRIKEGRYFEDDYTTWKWYYHANKIVVSNKILYYYFANPTSTMAQHHKKPSLDFVEAYNERIAFFQNTEEKDLEVFSRLQLCKALLLTFSNCQLLKDDRKRITNLFHANWKILRKSYFISKKYKLLFSFFNIMPLFTSRFVVSLRNHI